MIKWLIVNVFSKLCMTVLSMADVWSGLIDSRTVNNQAGCGLAQVKRVLRFMGDPQDKVKVIHVAGTNGKGSVCAYMGAVLRAEGYNVGVFTSPHLLRVNERIVINGNAITDEDFTRVQTYVSSVFERVSVGKPIFFELLTVMAYHYFAESAVDFAIIETGIGGRLDTTNAVGKPVLSVITAIGYDHMEVLGHTLVEIANEKAGIIKEGCPVALYYGEEISRRVYPVIAEAARRNKAKLYYSSVCSAVCGADFRLHGTTFSIETQYFAYHKLYIPLLGKRQVNNAALALICITALRDTGCRISDGAVYDGMSAVSWPGRFQLISKKNTIVLDGAHNKDGARSFSESLEMYFKDKKIVLLAGMIKTKDIRGTMAYLSKNVNDVICTQPSCADALPAEALADYVKQEKITIEPDFNTAYRLALTAASGSVTAVAGSLYLISDIIKIEMDGVYDRF